MVREPGMKTPLILFNGVGVAVFLAWIGYHLLKGLSHAYSNPNHATGPGDIDYVFVVVGLAIVACAVSSFFAPAGTAKAIALAPIAFVLLAQGFISYKESSNRERYRQEQVVARAARDKSLSRFSRDYVQKEDPREYSEVEFSFLTLDKSLQTIVQLDVGYQSGVHAYPIGKINGEVLETFDKMDSEGYYKRYVDAAGKSIFDRYTVRHRPGQKHEDYHLDQYGR
jgi:hypothetical protein